MRNLFVFCLILLFASNGNAQFGKLIDKAKKSDVYKKANDVLGEDNGLDIAGGLKEALEKGVDEAVSKLSGENGYLESPYKILLPDEAREVVDRLKVVPGFSGVEQDLIERMNAAAEIAAKKATPIFSDAIRSMSFDDARKILLGADDEATQYLSRTSRAKLYDEFMPVIQSSLDEVNARKYWKSVVDKYNSLPFVSKVNPELDDHVNNKSLDGLFALIQKKEAGIRNDVSQRTSPLLKDVFAELDKDDK